MTSIGDLLKLYQQGCLSDMHFLHVVTRLLPHPCVFVPRTWFYSYLVVLYHRSSIPSSCCEEELSRPSELAPCDATLCSGDAEESTLDLKSSSQGCYIALILLCMYPCKVLCMPVICFTATADSCKKPIYTPQRKCTKWLNLNLSW